MSDHKDAPPFIPQLVNGRINSLRDQEIDAAVAAYAWLPRAEAIKQFRQDIDERHQRNLQREAEAVEQAQREADERQQQKWRAHNPSFAELSERFLRETTDVEPVQRTYYNNTTAHADEAREREQRHLHRLIGFLILKVAALEAKQR